MTEQTTDGLESILNQIKSPIERARALYELASKGVQIPKEIASEYVVYSLFVSHNCWDPRGLNLAFAENFARHTGLKEIADLLARKMGYDNRFTNDQNYLDSTR
ncbi:MAG: hypothetical protein KKA65_05615 [Nanoarchaeota archaeon]|nr:hypothetical protein [Nanoarchaeota archaeon]MBU4351948.1 hypothetical protein [Nanoarchaeota archaeon]MBU4456948.1 hypothetical protein [Nanoarchaeota archaeon]MCG2719161.1 hypothetical protein [Nanoarchaeota archaeon]